MDLLFQIESFDVFKVVVDKILENMHQSEPISISEIDPHIPNSARDELKKIILSNNFEIDKVKEYIVNKGWDEERVQWFLSLVDANKNKIFYFILLHYNSKYGETVVNYDWLLKLVFGTSDSKVLKYPLFQLALTILDGRGQKRSLFDFNKETLSKLIIVLENYDDIQ